jgi:hypothetical protein
MDNPRTESAREHDDSEIIDNAEAWPGQSGSFGGNLQRDVSTEAELERVGDPDAHEGVEKKDKIDHQQESSTNHPADKTP